MLRNVDNNLICQSLECLSQRLPQLITLMDFYVILIFPRIVRNKAAEKAKHVHHQQTQQSSSTPPGKRIKLKIKS